jgi:hypothetical protein
VSDLTKRFMLGVILGAGVTFMLLGRYEIVAAEDDMYRLDRLTGSVCRVLNSRC